MSNYDTDKVIVPLIFFTSTFGGGPAQSSRAGGSLLRAPWPAGQSEKWIWCSHSSNEHGSAYQDYSVDKHS